MELPSIRKSRNEIHTGAPVGELHMRRFLGSAEGVEVGDAGGADAIGEGEA